MSRQDRRERPRATRREAAREKRPRPAQGAGRPWLLPVGVTLGLVAAAVIIFIATRPAPRAPNPSPSAQTSVIAQLTSVPRAAFDQVGIGSANKANFRPVSEPPLTSGGKPEVLYMGAEYCPFCAAERWALIAALSRFGTFSGVQTFTSSESAVPTFTFRDASYSSQYVSLRTRELYDNDHNRLQAPTGQEAALLDRYATGYPFVDFGNRLSFDGATYDYSVLTDMTWGDITGALGNADSDQAKAILGSANLIDASICKLTGDQPADVCSDPVIRSLEHQLPG